MEGNRRKVHHSAGEAIPAFRKGAYYAPDLTKAWLDPDREAWQAVTGADTREGAMVKFLMDPEQYRTWTRGMPNLAITEDEAQALVAYLKWMAAVDTNGFPPNFNLAEKK